MACAAAEPYVAKLEDAFEAKLENAFEAKLENAFEAKLENAFEDTMHSGAGSKPSPKVSNIVYIYT